MKFIETKSGAIINTAHIVSIQPRERYKKAVAVLSNGEEYVIDYEDTYRLNDVIVPAHPGYRIVYVDDDQVAFEDIVAWRIRDGAIEPIGCFGGGENGTIIVPAGTVFDPKPESWFDSLDAYLRRDEGQS